VTQTTRCGQAARIATWSGRPDGVICATPGCRPRWARVTISCVTNSPSNDAARTGLPAGLFTTIDHVGIAVPDLDEAIAFYAQAFGVQSVHEETNEEQGVREAMLAVGGGETRIQLLAPLTPESTIAKFIGRSGPGLQQLAFRVDDVEAVSATLRERGLRLLYDAPRRGTAGSRVNFVHPKDAGGVLVELVEPAAAGH
jgi:methylmalonyl-CoA/ethylmalonyl-CoA epimerase